MGLFPFLGEDQPQSLYYLEFQTIDKFHEPNDFFRNNRLIWKKRNDYVMAHCSRRTKWPVCRLNCVAVTFTQLAVSVIFGDRLTIFSVSCIARLRQRRDRPTLSWARLLVPVLTSLSIVIYAVSCNSLMSVCLAGVWKRYQTMPVQKIQTQDYLRHWCCKRLQWSYFGAKERKWKKHNILFLYIIITIIRWI
jgi:hypothetical protein